MIYKVQAKLVPEIRSGEVTRYCSSSFLFLMDREQGTLLKVRTEEGNWLTLSNTLGDKIR